jgi:sugar/nucleoside kinase (ribokinase family)
MKKFDIYGIGAALVDIELEVDDAFLHEHGIEKGQMTLVEPENQLTVLGAIENKQIKTKQASGGSAANTVFAASSFGSKNFYSCKTADDQAGNFFINDMKKAGINCTPNYNGSELPTGTCLVMVTPDAERTMNTYLAISESLSASEIDEEALKASNYLYMEGYLSTSDTGRHAAVEAKKIAEQNNCKTVLTFSDPAMVKFFKPQLGEMLGQGVDMLFCNEEEALGWCETGTLEAAIAQLKSISKSFAITLGAKGSLVFDGEKLIEVDANPVKAIDTNGAGDMFSGAFLHAVCSGYNHEQAGKLASLASSKVVSKFGPRLPVEEHKSLLDILN